MIYNLVEYLVANLATINFTSNGFKKSSPNNVVTVSETGGFPNPQINRKDYTIQVMSRGEDNPTARQQAFAVYDIINKKFGLTLPSVTVKSELFASVKTWKIVALALPGFIGNDTNGRPQFSTNYIITTE